MEAVVDFDDFDLDALLQSDLDPQILFSDDQDLLSEPAVVDFPIQTNDLPSPDWVSEIEQFLLVEGEEEEVAVEADPNLFEGIFAEFFAEGSSEEGRSDDSVAGSDGGVSEAEERGEKGEIGVQEVKIEEEEDLLSKKRKRQLRNRDSAMKSRERRKMYIKDLELKTRSLEAECKRLDYAFRCCFAENQALHQQLMKQKACNAHPKQESAVLVMESLLLGSLFWLVSMACLFFLPGPHTSQATSLLENAGILGGSDRGGSRRTNRNEDLGSFVSIESVSFCMGRRIKASRGRMKAVSSPLLAVSSGDCFRVLEVC